MPPTPLQYIRTAVDAMVGDAETAAAATVLTDAPSHYGTDFRITPGAGVTQVQITPQMPYINSNVSYPRAVVAVLIHHYIMGIANEESFTLDLMNSIADQLMSRTLWSAQSGIYGLQPGIDPEISAGERTGNVLTFEVSAVVLAEPA
jgi:hypothetical protein